MIKKFLAIVLGVMLFGICAAGCSSGDTTASSDTSASAEASEEASSAETAEEASASAETSSEASEDTSASSDAEGEVLKRVLENGKLIMLTNAAFPPYEYLGDDGSPAGVDVDVAQAIADEIGVDLEVVDMDFDGLIPALQSGKGDIVAAGMTVTDERKQSVDFTDTYADATQLIIVPAEGATVTGEEDLAGKMVGVQLGTTGDLWVTDNADAAEIKQYKNALEAAMDLQNGRLDAVVIDKLPAENIASSNDDLVLIQMESTDEQYAIAVEKNNQDLVDIINGVIARMLEDGSLESSTSTHVEASKVG